MCSICKNVLKDFGVDHVEALCPLRNSRYCSICAKYGHLTKSCPARPSIMFREPAFLEQLIAPSELIEFGITSKTPIKYAKQPEQRILEIADNDKIIGAYLSARSIKVIKGHNKRYTIEQYAIRNNYRLVYIK